MEGRLYSVVGPVLLVVRFCGLLPLSNIKRKSISQLRWKLSSLTFYSLFIWTIAISVFFRTIYDTVSDDKVDLSTTSYLKLFGEFGPPFLVTPAFLYISFNCGKSFKAWEEIETALPPIPTKVQNRIWLMVKFMIVAHQVHHWLLDYAEIEMKYFCLNGLLVPAVHIQYYMKFAFLFYGSCFPSPSRVLLAMAFQLIMDLQWVMGPVLIIAVTRTLDYQLELLNSTLDRFRAQVMPIKYWQVMRERFNNISRLTRIANDLLHPIIFVNCISEAIFIILFTHMILQYGWQIHQFVFVAFALANHLHINMQMLLSISGVSEISRRPMLVLTSVPTVVYNHEVSRFYDQVVYDRLALTGGKLFDVSRTFMVNVVSSLITYEVVLFQAHTPLVSLPEAAGANHTTVTQYNWCLAAIWPIYNSLMQGNNNTF